MQQVNLSPQYLKRRSSPSQGSSCAQSSKPIQPFKLPPFRPHTADPLEQQQPIPGNYFQKDSVTSDERIADLTGRRAAIMTRPMPSSLPKILDRQDLDRQDNVVVMPQLIQQPIRQPRKSWEWSLIGLVAVAGIFGGVGTSAILWLSSLPPLPRCEKVTLRSPDVQRLFCAQEAANSGKLQDLLTAINLLRSWSPDHPLKSEAQRLIARWSKEILTIAQEKIDQNDLKGAVKIARQVPFSSPAYAEVQTAIAHWQAQWQKGEATINIAQEAIQQKNWTQASKQVLMLGKLEPGYWRLQRADQLSQQILDGKQAQQALLKAKRIDAQKATQSGQPHVWEGVSGAIAQGTKPNESPIEEALSSLETQPVEVESTAPDDSFSPEVRSDVFPTDAAPGKSFEGYYDERYFENSY